MYNFSTVINATCHQEIKVPMQQLCTYKPYDVVFVADC